MKEVINNGYCIGCGGCQIKNNIKTKENKYGQFLPDTNDPDNDLESTACPFSNDIVNEFDMMKEKLSKKPNIKFNKLIGYYYDLYAGHVTLPGFRKKGTSGGMTKWLLCKLIQSGEIDGVIHVVRKKDNSQLFEYGISSTVDEILEASQSAYYPLNYSSIMNKILKEKNNKKYAFVGVPCFCKSMASLKNTDPNIANKIKYIIGIVCGHMKTKNFAKLMTWNAGMDPDSATHINFREKTDSDKHALDYNFYASNDKQSVLKNARSIGGSWSIPHLKYKACDYCEDVFGYCADVVMGDAWIPKYVKNPAGTNICIVRNNRIKEILEKYKHEVSLSPLTENEIIASQKGSVSHRIEHIGYRLYLSEQANTWHPKKRAKPEFIKDKRTREIQDLRVKIRQESHEFFYKAYVNNDVDLYYKQLDKYIEKLDSNYSK